MLAKGFALRNQRTNLTVSAIAIKPVRSNECGGTQMKIRGRIIFILLLSGLALGQANPVPFVESATSTLDRYAWKRSVHAHSERNGIRLPAP